MRDFRLLDTRGAHSAVRATSLLWVNEQSDPLLAVGSNDGVVRLWQHVSDAEEDVREIAGFAALPEVNTGDRGSGLVLQVPRRAWSSVVMSLFVAMMSFFCCNDVFFVEKPCFSTI